MPFAASITTRSGFTAFTSMKDRTASTNLGQMSSWRTCPRDCPSDMSSRAMARARMSNRPESPPTGSAPRRTIFMPGVLLRVVRGGDHDPALEIEVADGEVDHLGPDHPDVDDVGARLGRAAHGRLGHRRRREPHVAPNCDRLGLELVDVGAADRVGAGLVELVGIDPADVVCLENLRVEHRGDATASHFPAAVATGVIPRIALWSGNWPRFCSPTWCRRQSWWPARIRRSPGAA